MPVDLTNLLPSSPEFHDPNEWTPDRLGAQLDTWGIKYQWHDRKAVLSKCLFCNDDDGNPIVNLVNTQVIKAECGHDLY